MSAQELHHQIKELVGQIAKEPENTHQLYRVLQDKRKQLGHDFALVDQRGHQA